MFAAEFCHASFSYARANNQFIGSLYNLQEPFNSYILEVNTNKLFGWTILQDVQNDNFEWLSQEECRDFKLLLNYKDGRILIIYIGLFNHRDNNED